MTGATGFLGTALCKKLEENGDTIVKLGSQDADLTIIDSLAQFNTTPYSHIYHLAAWTQAGDFCLRHPGEQWVKNQLINTHVTKWWAESQPQAKFIFMGTSCAYAEGADLKEENYMQGEPIDSLYTYAMTKRMLYQGARAMAKQYDLNYLCLVPSTLYGPGYHTDGRQMHFIFDLIRKIIRAKEFGEKVTLWGDGNQSREIVHVDDFVSILGKLTASQSNDIFNVGAGEEFTIKTFANTICDILDYPADAIEYDTSKYVGAKSKCLNTDKVDRIITDFDMTPLRIGLENTIKWFYESKAFIVES